MKRLIPTLLLVIICIGGFWYASSKDFFKESKAPAASLVKVNKDEVASFTIKVADGEIELQRKDGKWTMSKPSPLPLNDYSADGWIESFNSLSKDKTVDANAADLAQFGLDKPSQQFKVTLNNGSSHTISIGAPVAIQGFSYAILSGSPEVFRLSDSQSKPLAMTPIDFMEKSPVKLEYDQIRSMSVEWKGQKWAITKTDTDKKAYESDWKLDEKVVKGPDANEYLSRLKFLSTEQPARPASGIKMNSPELKVEVKSVDASQKEITTVYLGKVEQDNVWFMKEGTEWAYAVPADSIQELANKDLAQPQAETPPAGLAPGTLMQPPTGIPAQPPTK
ncbi:DUF4340 domain-containing protein [Paenibacillus sp. LMG 31456]|uniref:DUF4340 domain-containing protein n=1 Tax=Paenibacillus foliorum TaxID=2654974 RepID=A0A972GYD7_9BACL|nr:DUF4340 domain-containing protein [Paenibacillus foliorum]NOU95160.1 DUF4340 domain-containing protein [Paenibacillus foliorum]